MNDITAIILTKNEELNIVACIDTIKAWVDRIVVVDSGSTDNTVELAKAAGADIFYHEWKHYADQFNWALDNVSIETKWVYRIDADERVPKELAEEIISEMRNHDNDDINGFLMNHTLYFLGRFLKHGGSNLQKITVFKHGMGDFEDRAMGEHIVLKQGTTIILKNYCLHYDCKSLNAYIDKHNSYATREVFDYYERRRKLNEQAYLYELAEKTKKLRDGVYYRLPKFFRARLYYWYRYYGQMGFLDGKPGKIYCYIQAYMYRYIIDAKIYEYEVREGK
ncbi:glycosyltransferase family 2 protein [Clostridiaceae bacterium HFYG-1003]|nr:glycosyltransferase family 2 protein [Clostridiaceae bacterium HFYG-1003]